MIFSAKKLFQNWFFFVNKGYHKPLLKIYITQKVRAIVDSGKVLLSYVFWRSNKFWFAQQLCLGLEQSFNNNLLALSRYNFHIRLPVLGGPSKKNVLTGFTPLLPKLGHPTQTMLMCILGYFDNFFFVEKKSILFRRGSCRKATKS